MSTTFKCPRRAESPVTDRMFARENDYDETDDTCRYCGSMNPDTFMARVEAGDVLLGATDKSYKVYVSNSGGASFKSTYRNCPWHVKPEDRCKGPDTCTHWTTRETNSAKFYFQHLSDEQRDRFIAIYNEKRIKFAGGIGFYVLPFFCRRVS